MVYAHIVEADARLSAVYKFAPNYFFGGIANVGTFIYNDKEEFYTAAQEILFDNTKQRLSFLYEKGSDYASGTYTLEVYTDDYQMGSGKFVVK